MPRQEGAFDPPNPRQVVVPEEQILAEIDGEFDRAGYVLDLSESPKGDGWFASYRPKDQEIGSAEGHFAPIKSDAARAALDAFRKEREN